MGAPPKARGKTERHMTVQRKQHGVTLRALAFGQADWVGPLAENEGSVDIAYKPMINEFRGFRKVELHLVDWRPTQSPAAVNR